MKKVVIGIVAHVDAGKTTLSEAMLYKSGTRDVLGRVDKQDAFLDTHTVERERGITVFSKQAMLSFEDTEITLIDTPGHVDFAPEAERALSIQDYAILVVSATDGPTAHTMTLFNLLSAKRIPTFIFVNKMDIAERRRCDILDEVRRAFGGGVVDFNLRNEDEARFYENAAGADESLMEDFFESGSVPHEKIAESIKRRKILPLFFGSAINCEGIGAFLKGINEYTLERSYSKNIFGARVYKIATDPTGARLTYMKITGGELKLKDTVRIHSDGEVRLEKVEGIRLYSADKYKSLKSAEAGTVCAVLGLSSTRAGMGLGIESSDDVTLEPVLDYRMLFADPSVDVYSAYLKLAPLADEEPSLSLHYDSATAEIKLRLMGEIQTEVLTRVIKDRFGFDVYFDEGSILYKETIEEKSYGAGHFEPLMHYAEVRLRLEPLERGAGLVFATNCPTDSLKANWQRLILSHLEERPHKGVLTGAHITDMRITLIAGKAHVKHTEGGDFRQATYRALRQGLMKSVPILLEPTFDFYIDIPSEHIGRAMTDIANMHGEAEPPEFKGASAERAILRGNAPVYTIRAYPKELIAYTRGKGRITFTVGEYKPCHNEDEIVERIGYSAELDDTVTADSIFCKSGAGYTVPWYMADEKMHTENPEQERDAHESESAVPERARSKSVYRGTIEEDRELMRIFESTYGKIQRRTVKERVENAAEPKERRKTAQNKKKDDYLLIDGYNYVYSDANLKRLAEADLSHARDTLIRLVCNYNGYKKLRIILVYDAYKRPDNKGSIEEVGGITVVYTKERETADAYIEKASYDLAAKNTVRVVTSDYMEQLIVLGNGAIRVSASEFQKELESVNEQMSEHF